ncbi:MAG: Small subunit (SSU) processome component [Cirrosporium novae-zelandiae]|nr:MAG: Small subunit (SSU) processome component [Cirrosporium novae-zelandiae]
MASKKNSQGPVSQISSKAAPASSATQQSAKSAILRSAFCPSEYQLNLFASVIQSFDSQHLRIHNVSSGHLQCEHTIGSKATITCLDWGLYPSNSLENSDENPKKKRKRSSGINGAISTDRMEEVVVAFGTSDSKIEMFSYTQNQILATLKDVHTQAVRDFKFTSKESGSRGWSLGADAKLVQWDITRGNALQYSSLLFDYVSLLTIATESYHCQTCLSQFLRDLFKEKLFTVAKDPAHTLIKVSSSDSDVLLAATNSDYTISVFDVHSQKPIKSLMTESDVRKISSCFDNQDIDAIATVTSDGTVELFSKPLAAVPTIDSTSLKKNQHMTKRADAVVKVIRSNSKGLLIPAIDATFNGDELVIVSTEHGVNLRFKTILWRDADSGDMKLKGLKEIFQEQGGIEAATVNGVKDMGKVHVDESHAVVNGTTTGDSSMAIDAPDHEVIEISSSEEEEDGSSEEESASESEPPENENDRETPDTSAKDIDMKDAGSELDDEEDAAEPSFGDLLRANAPETVDVAATFQDHNRAALAPSTSITTFQQPQSSLSLSTILTQSLRTNDQSLLESCFLATDFNIVRTTIERLDSMLAAQLLEKLADRLHRRPGRAGSLMVWIQWTVVAHGGYLANQKTLMKKIQSLTGLLDQRASNLTYLLSLKGKLDMLEAQLSVRRNIAERSREVEVDEDEEDVIYVEGQDDSDSDEEITKALMNGVSKSNHLSDTDIGSEDDEPMPTLTNGVVEESDLDEDSDDLVDDEAEETENEIDEEDIDDDVDHDDVDDMIDDEDDSDEDSPAPHRVVKTKKTGGFVSSGKI